MKNVIFENDGVMDIRMISTFGCSVKESKNPIGFFGTGGKFAFAVLLRTGHKITLQCGDEEYQIESKHETIRGKEFNLVQAVPMDGGNPVPLGFTTELGKTWEVWMAYRELYCNAKDEPNWEVYDSDSTPVCHNFKTRIFVSGDQILSAHNHKSEFILDGEPDYKFGDIEVFNRPSNGLFYKGIKIASFEAVALYTYNQTAHTELTEDRTAKNSNHENYRIAMDVLGHAPREILESILVAGENSFESKLDFHGWSTIPCNDFFATVADLQRNALVKVNRSALRLWQEKGRGFISPRKITATKVQSAMLKKAISFCEKTGFALRDEYPILICETLGENGCLAMADLKGKQILLTERIFNQGGTKGVARALMEEYIHLKYGLHDSSREMQNFIFDKMVSLAEELTGEPI